MKTHFNAAMRRATDLVRSGDLSAATDLIRSTLGSAPETAESGAAARPAPDQGLRKGLGQTLKDLAARMPQGMPGSAAEVAPLSEGASFGEGRFACAAGSRGYRVYVPQLAGAPQGLILMLHGCTQSPVDFANGTGMNRLADRHGLIVVYPAQPRSANMKGCWNWFQSGDQERDSGEPAILAGMTRELRDRHQVPDTRVFVAGLSAGAAMAVILGRTYPELFAGVGAHSGLPYKAANSAPGAFAAMGGSPSATQPAPARPAPTIVFHGSEDRTVDIGNGARIADEARPGGAEVIDGGSAGGRSFTRTSVLSPAGRPVMEYWRIEGLGHAWSGGDSAGSYTDPEGPDASAEMVRFFLELPRRGA